MSETQGTPQLSGNMFLFERPELMNKEQHSGLGLKQPDKRFGFAAKARAIPITVTEIPAAMKNYPVIFMSSENPLPLAVVGLIDDINLFVDENGNWDPYAYVPGYVRRYPFGLANEQDSERMAIVIDAAYEGISAGGEIPLFQESGEPSEMTQSAIEFCKAFERDRQMTDDFGQRLKPFDLIHGQSAHFTPQGETEQKSFAEYNGIDEKRLNELSDEQFLELRKTGFLPLLYAMVMSMGNWRALLQRRAQRFGLEEAQITDRIVN